MKIFMPFFVNAFKIKVSPELGFFKAIAGPRVATGHNHEGEKCGRPQGLLNSNADYQYNVPGATLCPTQIPVNF